MAQSPRLHSLLSFARAADAIDDHARSDSGEEEEEARPSFDFAFAPSLSGGVGGGGEGFALADDLFAHGRIVPAYPVFDRRLVLDKDGNGDHRRGPQQLSVTSSTTAPPSPDRDSYCAWTPRSAPGSPSRDTFPKSASTGEARRWRLRDLVGAGGRSHSDGKEKFLFLRTSAAPPTSSSSSSLSKASPAPEEKKLAKKPQQQQKQSTTKKKKKDGVVTEMDMATAHRLFYSKAGGGAGGERKQPASYLPYRPGIVGFFANVHAVGGRSPHHHPY